MESINEVEVMEKKVTKDQALERINDNFEVIDTAYGRIKASKRWFAVCGTIGAIAAGIGVAGIATVGFVLAPVATTGLGVAAAVVSAKFYSDENIEHARLLDADNKNFEAKERIEAKVKTK